MTSVVRPYINHSFNQGVDDGCLEYKSIAMAVVNDLIKVNIPENDYTGIKQIYNVIPPRPININAMATSIARINNLPYSEVESISAVFVAEEIAATTRFVANNPMYLTGIELPYIPEFAPQPPTQSSTGIRLEEIATSRGTQTYRGSGINFSTQTNTHTMSDGTTMTNTDMVSSGTQMYPDMPLYKTHNKPRNMSVLEGVSFLLGDEPVSSGVVAFNPSVEVQTEWQNTQQLGFRQRKITFGSMPASSEMYEGGVGRQGKGLGVVGSNIGKGFVSDYSVPFATYRPGMASQTIMFKPPSGKNIPKRVDDFPTIPQTEIFFESNNEGTLEGTTPSRLSSMDRTNRAEKLVGASHSITRFFKKDPS